MIRPALYLTLCWISEDFLHMKIPRGEQAKCEK
jgi:hypothetical protein